MQGDWLDRGRSERAEVGVRVDGYTVGLAFQRTAHNGTWYRSQQDLYGQLMVPGDGQFLRFGAAASFLWPIGPARLGAHATVGLSRWLSPMDPLAYETILLPEYGEPAEAGLSELGPRIQAGGRVGVVIREDAGLVLDIDVLGWGPLGLETGVTLGLAAGL